MSCPPPEAKGTTIEHVTHAWRAVGIVRTREGADIVAARLYVGRGAGGGVSNALDEDTGRKALVTGIGQCNRLKEPVAMSDSLS